MNKPNDKPGKKPYSSNGSYGNSQNYQGYKPQYRGGGPNQNGTNNSQMNPPWQTTYERKPRDEGVNEEGLNQQNSYGRTGGVPRGPKDNYGGMDRKKKGLGRNKFHQIYYDIANQRNMGMECEGLDWLSDLRMRFPQIFSMEHLAPVFVDKNFTDKYCVGDAFDKAEKRSNYPHSQQQVTRHDNNDREGGTHQGGFYQNNNNSNNNNNQQHGYNNNQGSSQNNFHQQGQKKNIYDSDGSGSDPEWEVNNDDFVFVYKSFDKEKHAEQMKLQQDRQKSNYKSYNSQITRGDEKKSEQQEKQQVPAQEIKIEPLPKQESVESGEFSAMQFFSMIQKETVQPEIKQEFELEYEEIDAKLERLINEKKDKAAIQPESDILELPLPEARQIVLNTVVQDEFQDEEESSEEDEYNDETFGMQQDPQPVQQANQNHQIESKEQAETNQHFREQKTSQVLLEDRIKENIGDSPSGQKQVNRNSSSFISAGIIGNSSTSKLFEQENYDQPHQQNNNYFNQQQQGDNSINQLNRPPKNEFVDSNFNQHQQTENAENKQDEDEEIEYERGQLEELIMKNQDEEAEEMCEMILEGNERKEQEEKKKERERQNLEKISEIMSQEEEDKQNYFSAVSYRLLTNPQEPIWVYKDDQGIQQGPFDSNTMDQWKQHFSKIDVSYSKLQYWIKYQDLTLYCQHYADRVKNLLSEQKLNQQNQKSVQQIQQQPPPQQPQQQILEPADIFTQLMRGKESSSINMNDPSAFQQQMTPQQRQYQQELFLQRQRLQQQQQLQQQSHLLQSQSLFQQEPRNQTEINPMLAQLLMHQKQQLQQPQQPQGNTNQGLFYQQQQQLIQQQQQQQLPQQQWQNNKLPQQQVNSQQDYSQIIQMPYNQQSQLQKQNYGQFQYKQQPQPTQHQMQQQLHQQKRQKNKSGYQEQLAQAVNLGSNKPINNNNNTNNTNNNPVYTNNAPRKGHHSHNNSVGNFNLPAPANNQYNGAIVNNTTNNNNKGQQNFVYYQNNNPRQGEYQQRSSFHQQSNNNNSNNPRSNQINQNFANQAQPFAATNQGKPQQRQFNDSQNPSVSSTNNVPIIQSQEQPLKQDRTKKRSVYEQDFPSLS